MWLRERPYCAGERRGGIVPHGLAVMALAEILRCWYDIDRSPFLAVDKNLARVEC